MQRPLLLLTLAAALAALLVAAGCDNIGRAFDPSVDPGNQNPTSGESAIQVVPAGGDARDGRPKVKAIAPKDGGWPVTVPIVIEFTESVNEASIAPTTATGTDGRIVLRVAGTTQVMPCLYGFLAGGRVLVMRPVTELSNEQNPSYEVVLLPDARDTDGVRFSVTDEVNGDVLTTFQVNQSQSISDGRILATYPRDNQRDATRETPYLVVFDRPANANSLTATNLFVRPRSGSALSGETDLPLDLVGEDDGRCVRFTPSTPLAAASRYELVVDDTITFGSDGTLDFRGRTPFAVFDTISVAAPTAVHVENPTPGFLDKINRSNLPMLRLRITSATDAVAGDTIVARIYGFDRETEVTGDVNYVEGSGVVPAPGGEQGVTIDFSGDLGTVASPVFEDGGIDFAVQARRGDEHSGFFLNDPDDEPRLDVTPPTVTAVGPPGVDNDVYTDLEHFALHGTASEAIGEAMLTDGASNTATLFGSADDGFFTLGPVQLDRLAAPRGYTLTVTDLAGNPVDFPTMGNIVQRGAVTGTVAGTLTIEAYDHATLQPIANATVLVDPPVPTVPATNQMVATTDANGVATFSGLAGSSHTVTVVAADYDLTTFYATNAARLSLPLRPLTDATASFTGLAGFQTSVGTTVVIGNNAIDDPAVLTVSTSSGEPNTIPSTAIVANRAQVVTAFGGSIEPSSVPAFTLYGYEMLGPTLLTPTASAPPAPGGGTAESNVALLPASGATANLTMTHSEDFALAAGLDTGNLVGMKPIVRVMAGLEGFGGQALAGLGAAALQSGAQFEMNATYGLPLLTGFLAFSPRLWLVTEARDSGGRISRHRALINLATGGVDDFTDAPGIPVITAPSGPSTGSPLVTYDDVLSALPGTIGLTELTATDPAGRRWRVLRVDPDGASGTESVQLPDLAAAAVTGLLAGTWNIRVENRLFIEFAGPNDFLLSEARREEGSYARSATQSFTVQ